ncbi:DUF2391 family protein [Candidatus Woesearchaeota archaeon]|nr:DUF2391 family protein [Candidatus Woesearchaeota archaeon]
MAKPALKQVAEDVRFIREEMVERVPHHFNMKRVVGAAFGALIFGLTFVPKGLFIDVTQKLTDTHIWFIIATTIVILSSEIYYIGYARVRNKSQRRFGQFWVKRLASYLVIGFVVSWFLIYLYGINFLLVGPEHLRNMVVALGLPCCIGASIEDLLQQY